MAKKNYFYVKVANGMDNVKSCGFEHYDDSLLHLFSICEDTDIFTTYSIINDKIVEFLQKYNHCKPHELKTINITPSLIIDIIYTVNKPQ